MEGIRFLCIINTASGARKFDYVNQIKAFFSNTPHNLSLLILTHSFKEEMVRTAIREKRPQRIIVIGGDGTINLVATCLLKQEIPIAIVPAGSANGMAKEFNLSFKLNATLRKAIYGIPQWIHGVSLNGKLCIHLADIGVNAQMIKAFQSAQVRGMLGYLKATFKALKKPKRISIEVLLDDKTIKYNARMIVIANGTTYGSGALINRGGSLFDEHFELIICQHITLWVVLKMLFFKKMKFKEYRIAVISTQKAIITCEEKAYFQIDGEYMGKTKYVNTVLIKNAIQVLV